MFKRDQVFKLLALFLLCTGLYGCPSKIFPEALSDFDDRALNSYRIREWDKAILDWDNCARLEPDNVMWYYKRSRAYTHSLRGLQARDDANMAINKAKENDDRLPYFYHARGDGYLLSGDPVGAESDYTKAINLAGDGLQSAPFFVDRGRAYIDQNKIDLALADLDHAIELVPTWGRAYFYRSKAEERAPAPRNAQAAADLTKSQDMEYYPNDDVFDTYSVR